jgi:hypothetical protein
VTQNTVKLGGKADQAWKGIIIEWDVLLNLLVLYIITVSYLHFSDSLDSKGSIMVMIQVYY